MKRYLILLLAVLAIGCSHKSPTASSSNNPGNGAPVLSYVGDPVLAFQRWDGCRGSATGSVICSLVVFIQNTGSGYTQGVFDTFFVYAGQQTPYSCRHRLIDTLVVSNFLINPNQTQQVVFGGYGSNSAGVIDSIVFFRGQYTITNSGLTWK